MRDLVTIDSRNLRVRLMLGVTVAVALTLGWFGIRWQVGSMLADFTPPSAPEAGAIADVAADLAPGDPVVYWLRGSAES